MALEFCDGIIPERGKIIAIAEAIGNDLFPMDGILGTPDLKALPVERHICVASVPGNFPGSSARGPMISQVIFLRFHSMRDPHVFASKRACLVE
jgi:hypothetical protein